MPSDAGKYIPFLDPNREGGKLTTEDIGTDTLLAEDIAAGAVETSELANDAVTGDKLWNNIRVGTVSVDPPSIAATTSATFTVTLTCAATDKIILIPLSTIEAGLIFQGANITAANTVTIRLYNYTAAAVDGVALDWVYILLE